MNELNNGQLLKEIHNLVIMLDERTKNMKEQIDKITPIFQPNGVCDRARRLSEKIDARSRTNAKLVYLILGVVIGLAFFVIRTFILHI